MSLIKLKKSNRRPIPVPQNQRQHKPVFLGDSIGKRLQQQSYHIQHREIGWWCGWGRNSNKAVKWMKDNLETELQLINQKIWLYVLIETCDFTNFNPSTKIIDLKYTETKEIVNHLVNNYKQIQQLLETLSPNSEVTFLTIPFYSIEAWNKKHKHKEPTKFREQDYKLEEQILAVNSEIKKLNKENHQEAPEFNSDLYRTSNRQKKTYAGNPSSSRHGETKSRRLYNIELLKDGIHPDIHLARAWLMKVTLLTIKDCWKQPTEEDQAAVDQNNNDLV